MAGDRHGLSVAAGQPCRFTANVVTIRWVGLSPTRYRISWTKAADFSGTATEYVVQARARGHGWRSIAAHVPAPATSIVWTKARAGTKYQFRVAGIGKGGRGPWSGIA
jgi:hypothetical protein